MPLARIAPKYMSTCEVTHRGFTRKRRQVAYTKVALVIACIIVTQDDVRVEDLRPRRDDQESSRARQTPAYVLGRAWCCCVLKARADSDSRPLLRRNFITLDEAPDKFPAKLPSPRHTAADAATGA